MSQYRIKLQFLGIHGFLLNQDLLFPRSFCCLLLGWQRGCEKEGTTDRLGVGAKNIGLSQAWFASQTGSSQVDFEEVA